MTPLPLIIQGGMGVAVSGWRLARAVSQLGQLGVVSGTALAVMMARRLQSGDPGGHLRGALESFPLPAVSERILSEHFRPEGRLHSEAFRLTAMPTVRLTRDLEELTVAANFAEVFLAKRGHAGRVGLNLLEKIQLPTLASLYGAMLAGVDYVLMGAGIPRTIPGALDLLAVGQRAELKLEVRGALPGEEFVSSFDPRRFFGDAPVPALGRPHFIGIVGSATLALALAKKSTGRVDGFVVESHTAGGHNSPPRGAMQLSSSGEPVYGDRDVPDLDKIRELGLPFWLAGSYGRPGRLKEALGLGAAGIQVGTAFAFCEESGVSLELKAETIRRSLLGQIGVYTDPVASPTGFPFKVLQMPGTLADAACFAARTRVCDLGYLRHLYRCADGSVSYRCPAEPVADYVRKGGMESDTAGRMCICNGLPGAVGLGQVRGGQWVEPPLLTVGEDVGRIREFLPIGATGYAAADVVDLLVKDTASVLTLKDRRPVTEAEQACGLGMRSRPA